ncbi:MAG TPA: hypothetical protein VNN07_18775 [Candidatus Tectomicrobia bacterium]|nr:hypothetical protein [Candidatus Tectomicrobia bacterium]
MSLAVLLILVLGFAAPLARAIEVLYGITFDSELIKIDTSTGAGTLVGNLDSSMSALGLADSGGNLYTFDQTADVVRQLDPATGGTVATIDIGTGPLIGEGGFTLRDDGTGFLSTSRSAVGRLYGVDIGAGTSAPITAPGGLTPSMDGLALGPGGVLYGISQGTATLHTIDESTGATTVVGDTGDDDDDNLSGLAFNDAGQLFGEIDGDLVSIDPTTGLATVIGPIGFDNVSGLTFLDVQPQQPPQVPLPATLLLVGLGLPAMAIATRSRRR